MNKILLLLLLVPTILFSQKNKDIVMPMGGGIYIVSKTGATGFTSLGTLRRRAIDAANEFAKKNNSVAEANYLYCFYAWCFYGSQLFYCPANCAPCRAGS